MGINDGLDKIRLETNADIKCINNNDTNQTLDCVSYGLDIACWETNLGLVTAKCFGLLDASVIFPIRLIKRLAYIATIWKWRVD